MAERGRFGQIAEQLGNLVGKVRQLEQITEPQVTDVQSLKAAALARAQREELQQGLPKELLTRASDADQLLQLLSDPFTAPYVRPEDLEAAGFGFLLPNAEKPSEDLSEPLQREHNDIPSLTLEHEKKRSFLKFSRQSNEPQYVPPVEDAKQTRMEELADRFARFRKESGVDQNTISLGREMALRPGTISQIAPRAFPESSSADAAGQKALKARTPLQERLPDWGMQVDIEPGVGRAGARYSLDIIDRPDTEEKLQVESSPISLENRTNLEQTLVRANSEDTSRQSELGSSYASNSIIRQMPDGTWSSFESDREYNEARRDMQRSMKRY